MNILVTGASGFIGKAAVEELKARGYNPAGLDRHPKDQGIHVFEANILDRKSVFELVRESDGIINLAGVLGTSELLDSVLEAVQVNIEGAVNIFDACAEYEKPAVQISTGNRGWPSIYPQTKGCAEEIALTYNKYLGTRIAVVRAMNAYGGGQKYRPVRKYIPNLLRWAFLNEPARIYGDGEQIVDPIYVTDLAKILVDALEYAMGSGSLQTVFEAGTGQEYTINQVADEVWKAVRGWSVAPKLYEKMRAGEPPKSRTVASLSTLDSLYTDYYGVGVCKQAITPRFVFDSMPDAPFFNNTKYVVLTSFKNGLQKTVEWYRQNPSILDLTLEQVTA